MKKTLIAALLATASAAGAAFAVPTAALNHDPATYRNVHQKAAADYKAATAKCASVSGNDKDVCMEQAKADRARAEADAVAKYNNTEKGRAKSRAAVADAEFGLAKAKCDAMTGAEKDNCVSSAKSVHTAAVADAKSGNNASGSSASGSTNAGLVTTTDTRDPAKAAAVDKCAQTGDKGRIGCLVDNQGATTAGDVAKRTGNAAETAADKTGAVAATVADKTKELASSAVEKTKQLASTVAQKTENTMDRAGDKTRAAASTTAQKTDAAMDNAGDKTRAMAGNVAANTRNATETAGEKSAQVANKTGVVAADSMITTKVKANIFKEPDLKSMGIHVETEKGVVMLSGFVNSKAEADKAIKVARDVEGVTTVKSAIKVK
jgi:osmotically-inducible protein OsmY